MKIEDFLTEEELSELNILNRVQMAAHRNAIMAAANLYRKMVYRDMEEDKALQKAAKEANIRPRELQIYLKDHGLLPN